MLRGLPLVQVPTTLLGQVDAAIGGKTGVDHALGKNLIGAFHQPRLVVVDVSTLRSLPRREFVAGLAEVIKYAVIRDAELFATLEAQLDGLLGLDESVLVPVVASCCEHKAAVVAAEDAREWLTRREGRIFLNSGTRTSLSRLSSTIRSLTTHLE